MLIIYLSGLGLASVFVSAFAVGWWLVVIRIAAYRNRFNNKNLRLFRLQQPIFRQPHMDTTSVALPPLYKAPKNQ
jgi:hypothetical protein